MRAEIGCVLKVRRIISSIQQELPNRNHYFQVYMVLTSISIEAKECVEGALESIDLGREIDDRWNHLKEDDGVSEKLTLESIGDEVTRRLMIAHDAGLAKAKATPRKSGGTVGEGWHPPERLPTRPERFVWDADDSITAE